MNYQEHSRKHRAYRMSVIICIILAAAMSLSGCAALYERGRTSLYSSAATERPLLTSADFGEEEEKSAYFDEGWIQYKGDTYAYNKDILSFVVMGVDDLNRLKTAKDFASAGDTDGMFLSVMNPHTKLVYHIAVPGITMVDMDIFNAEAEYVETRQEHIGLAHVFGDGRQASCENQVSYVSKLFHWLPIHGYLAFNIGVTPKVNETVGGVPVPVTYYKDGEIGYQDAIVELNGDDALRYVTKMYNEDGTYADVYRYRMVRQKEYLRGYSKKLGHEIKKNPAKAVEVFMDIAPYSVSDITSEEVLYLATQAKSYKNADHIWDLEGTYETTEDGYEMFYVDEEKLRELMLEMFYEKVDPEEIKRLEELAEQEGAQKENDGDVQEQPVEIPAARIIEDDIKEDDAGAADTEDGKEPAQEETAESEEAETEG